MNSSSNGVSRKHALIGHAVQAYTAGNAQLLQAGLAVQLLRHGEQDFFRHLLDAGRDVGVMLVELAQFSEVRRRVAKVGRKAGRLGEEQHLGRAWLSEQLRQSGR